MLSGWSSEKKIVSGFGIALIAVALALFSPYLVHPGAREIKQWVEQRQKVFDNLQSVLTDFREAQLYHRDFVLSGDARQADDFNEAVARLRERLFSLRTLDDDTATAEQFRRLENELESSITTLRTAMNSRKEKSITPKRMMEMSDNALVQSNAAAASIERLENDQIKLLQERISQYSSLPNYQVLVGFLLITFLGLLGLGTFLMSKNWQNSVESLKERNQLLEDNLSSAQAHLDKLANKDLLTEVLNVRGLEQSLIAEQNRAGRAGAQLVGMLLNIDNFRRVNEGLGHAVGDVILKELSRRIGNTLRPSDHIGRIGRDEFLVLLPDTQLAYAMKVAERIRLSVSDSPLRNASDLIHLTVSAGVATLPQKVSSLEEVLTLTRSALKRSKLSGKNKVSVARDGASDDENPVARDIVDVLCDASAFRTVFQPIIDLSTEQVSGYEILSRGPDGAFESPADFFRVCVENNILTTVDLSCVKLCINATNGVKQNMRFHLNIFPSTLLDTPIEQLLSLFPAQPDGRVFCVEISEQQFVGDPAYMRDHVNALKQAGILVAIDDVGFGRSSLESLILLEPDLVKVDRKYVTGVSVEPSKARLMKRLANVAKSLGAEIVAEGIENSDDIPVLKEIGVHYGQGWLFGELLEVLPGAPAGRRANDQVGDAV
ncbi:MAG TPA: EAL domain-containing protein [Candidatus Melainabacteria bacterium]|jgi:diguanylate cyclase (GGDEF)-like protein|nr:EAL domain-containing protein [Candidatus Melainabacteria bacterium]HIN64268.1 EAL domain-containing protein [Candidatus Obscuribacterales bacterium]